MSVDSNFPRLARPPVAVSIPTAGNDDDPLGPPAPPEVLRRRYDQLNGQRIRLRSDQQRIAGLTAQLSQYLAVAPQVESALEVLSNALFGSLANIIERQLTLALQEVLQ